MTKRDWITSPELKPCPFCGEAPRVFRRKDENLWNHDIVDWTTITCNECDITMCWPSSIDEETFAKWNERPGDAVIEAAQKVADCHRILDSKPDNSAMSDWIELHAACSCLALLLPPREKSNA